MGFVTLNVFNFDQRPMVMRDSIRVLHVDDEPSFADMAADFLEREDERIEVITETAATDGLDVLAAGDVDCIVSDYDMPGMDGLEFLKVVREEHSDYPFFLYTGKGSEELASDAISTGVTDYLQKGSGTDQYTLLANRLINAVEKRDAKKEARATTRRFETLLEHSADYIHVLSSDGIAKYHSPSVKHVLGYEPAELDETNPFERLHPDDREKAWSKFEECVAEPGREVTAEMRARHRDGSWRWLEVKSRNLLDDPAVGGVVGNVRDITEHKNTEAAVDWHKAVIRNMGEGVYVFDADYAFQFVSCRAGNIGDISERNWTNRQLSYLSDRGVLSDSEVSRIREETDRIVAGDAEQVTLQVTPSLPESSTVVELRLTSIEGDTDRELILGTTRDITEYKEHERELLEEKAFSDAALEGLADFYWAINLDGTVTRWSDTDGEVTGYTADEAVGMHSSAFHPDEHVPRIQQTIEKMREEGPTAVEAELLTKHGERIPYYFTGVPITDDSGQIHSFCGLGQDITEQKERERELERQNERLEEFASIVSHDLQNPLRIVEGHLELARETSPSDHLVRAGEALERSQALIEDLLTLAREGKAVGELGPVNLADVAESSWQTMESGAAALETNGAGTLRADRSRIQQLLENLFRNAVEHSSNDVTVSVGTVDDSFYVMDTGPGIPAGDRERIFEAGYSTSEDGTGFGLRIVEQIADAHGWEITVGEGEQGGTRFEFTGVEFVD
jgi:PAS domain S-box-containing protein